MAEVRAAVADAVECSELAPKEKWMPKSIPHLCVRCRAQMPPMGRLHAAEDPRAPSGGGVGRARAHVWTGGLLLTGDGCEQRE